MPIFEYKCKQCNSKFEVLHKSSLNQEEVSCPSCNSKENQKLLSSFSATGFSSSNSAIQAVKQEVATFNLLMEVDVLQVCVD